MDADARMKWSWLTDEQHGVVAKKQIDDVGIGRGSLGHRLKSGQWRRVHRGVYAAFTGELTREARLWAAILRAGRGAVLSHETAAELQRLTDEPSPAIHVTVPASRRPAQNKPIPGVVIHRSRHIQAQELPEWELPRTRIEYTTAVLLRAAAVERKRMRWRKWLDDALTDVAEGVYFHIEWHYRRDVELAHGLPKGVRQPSRVIGGGKDLKEFGYSGHSLRVELDGRIYHTGEGVAKDQRRDTVSLAAGDVRTLRFGHVDVTERACTTAALVAAALRGGGWDGASHPCRRECRWAGLG
jgi:hypothetical protein